MRVGRSGELRRIRDLLADDTPVVVAGEAGVGKTTVLRAAAHSSGRTVHEGGALSTLDWLDYLVLERALRKPMVAGDAVAVAADIEASVGADLLLLDDLHWAAVASLDVIVQLAGRVGMLAGVRTGEPGTARVLEYLEAAGCRVVELSGLDPAESAELVAALRPDLGQAARARLVRRTGGNPLLLSELAGTGEPSASLRLAIEARLRRLDLLGREAFGLLAVSGRPVNPAAIGDAGVKSLLAADLAVLGESGLEVRHALLAEVALEGMGADERRELHARMAANVDDDGEAARHHALAGQRDLALAAAMRAVQRATRPGEQASHLAIAAVCATGPAADELRLRAARALEAAHDWEEMIAVLGLIDAANTEAQAAACLLRARGAYAAGDVDRLRSDLAAGLDLVGGTGSDVEVQLHIEQTRVPVFIDGDAEVGLAMARRGVTLAEQHGVDLPRARYLLGTALAVFDQPDAVAELSAAIAAARAAGDTTTEFLAASNLVSTHEMSGDPSAGRDLTREYIARAGELGLGDWQQVFRVALAGLDFHAGAYEQVVTEAEDLLTQRLDKRAVGQLIELLCVTLVDLGRIDEALRRLDSARADLVDDTRGSMEELWVRMEAAYWDGRPADALPLAQRYLASSDTDMNRHFGSPTHAWSCLELGSDIGAPVEEQERPIMRAIPVEVEGVRALAAGDPAAAAALFTDAAGLWAPYHLRGELRCLWAAGEATRRTGATTVAIELLEAVEARARDRGMLPLLGRVHRSLRAAGVRRSAPRTRSAGGLLTGRQHEVLALVADGLTNAQIAHRLGISRHTVVTQLGSASVKLGATSRAQAASMAASTPG